MAKRRRPNSRSDSVFVLKLVFYFILGTLWLRVIGADDQVSFSFPVGLVAGFLFAHHDHFMIDRKIEFAVLFVAAVLSAYIPIFGLWL